MPNPNQLRYAVKNLYKNLLFMGREYPLGFTYFRDKCHNVFWKNKDIEDPAEIQKRLQHGDYIIKELQALYMLKKYRTLRSRYYKNEPHHETILKATKKMLD